MMEKTSWMISSGYKPAPLEEGYQVTTESSMIVVINEAGKSRLDQIDLSKSSEDEREAFARAVHNQVFRSDSVDRQLSARMSRILVYPDHFPEKWIVQILLDLRRKGQKPWNSKDEAIKKIHERRLACENLSPREEKRTLVEWKFLYRLERGYW
jgi:hypothetical protein